MFPKECVVHQCFFCFKCNIVNKASLNALVLHSTELWYVSLPHVNSTHTVTDPPKYTLPWVSSVFCSKYSELWFCIFCVLEWSVIDWCLFWLNAWKPGGSFKFQKSLRPSMFTPTQTSLYCSGGTNLNLNYTLYSCWYYLMWQTCWHSNCSAAPNKSENQKTVKKFRFKRFPIRLLCGVEYLAGHLMLDAVLLFRHLFVSVLCHLNLSVFP